MSIVSQASPTTKCCRSVLIYLFVAKARGMVTELDHPSCGPVKLLSPPVKYSESKPSIRSAPPTLGQHTQEVLSEMLRMSDADIEALKQEGVVA